MTTLIRNGTVILPDKTCKADILLQDGRVAAVASDLAIENAASVDAGGCLVLPGGIDVHTHITLDLDAALGTDLYYRGTLPALAGGTTSIIDHMAFMPKGRSPDEQAALYLDLAKGQSVVDYAFHGVIQPGYEFEDLKRLAARGVTSVKAYMTYAGRLDDATLLGLLKDCRKLGLLLAVHAEDHDCVESRKQAFKAAGRGEPIWHAASRPAECEAKAVARLLRLAKKAGDAPVYIVHLSTASGLEEIVRARAAGQKNILVETCLQYLLLTGDCYNDPETGLRYIMAPPLREQADVEALWQGLRDGHIQTVATDHCSFTLADKARGRGDFTLCPGGAPGLEERMALLYSEGVAKGRISLERFVELTAFTSATLFGLTSKGNLLPGADADLIILDPAEDWILHAADLHGPSDYSLYEGWRVQGRIKAVFARGHAFFHNDQLEMTPGFGRYLKREISASSNQARS